MANNEVSMSVIVATYNRPNSLRLCLEGFARQTDLDFEMLIADDGSDPDTPEMVNKFAEASPYPIEFVTQKHTIFRKTRVVNKAVARSRGRRLMFCDGDCIPYHNYMAVHKKHLRPKAFNVGGYIRLTIPQSLSLNPERVRAGDHERISSFFKQRAYLYKVHVNNLFYRLIRKKYKPKILGGNFSLHREDYYLVNGYDERYQGFGAEDSDMRNRLRNNGLVGTSIWNKAFICHLDHNSLDPVRPGQRQDRDRRDKDMYDASRQNLKAVKGLDQHL